MEAVKSAAVMESRAHTIFVLGRTGGGKTAQIVTLPGKKFVYIWEPNAMETLRGYANVDYLDYIPQEDELEIALKGFNKDTLTDRKTVKEPKTYERWRADYAERRKSGFFQQYDWICIDSFTFMVSAMIERQMFLDKRSGEPPDMGDYRVVGDSLRRIVLSMQALNMNLFLTGHLSEYQNEKTKQITVQANLPGQSRTLIPLGCTNIWQCEHNGEASKDFVIRTKPDLRGLRELRTTIPNLKEFENVTIPVDASGRFVNPEKHGIGALLVSGKKATSAAPVKAAAVVVKPAPAAATAVTQPTVMQPTVTAVTAVTLPLQPTNQPTN